MTNGIASTGPTATVSREFVRFADAVDVKPPFETGARGLFYILTYLSPGPIISFMCSTTFYTVLRLILSSEFNVTSAVATLMSQKGCTTGKPSSGHAAQDSARLTTYVTTLPIHSRS